MSDEPINVAKTVAIVVLILALVTVLIFLVSGLFTPVEPKPEVKQTPQPETCQEVTPAPELPKTGVSS